MKNVQKLGLLLILGTLIFQTSCTREAFIERQEDRIVGDWYFSRVSFTDFLVFDNITDQYDDAQITFFSDYTLTYFTDDGGELSGTWFYNVVDGNEENIGQLVMQLEDVQTGEDFLFLWDDFTVWNGRMNAQEDYDGGQLHYVLRSL